jgi:lipid-binding SYLF domain-containing protein
MKALTGTVLALFLATSAFAAVSKDEARRLNEAGSILTALRNAPDNNIPEDLWSRAHCVVVIPGLKKAAFVVGGEYGSGVMSCRRTSGGWSAPVFMQLAKGSVGFQLGAQEVDLVMLVMNQDGVDKLLRDKVSLGADASVAAGPVGRSANAATDARLSAEMLAYSRSKGLFAGVDLSGGTLRPDNEANARAYGSKVTTRDIVVDNEHVTMPVQARSFVDSLNRDIKATTGQK